jgi:RNA polymerase sigma factor (sigma-70 family)
MLSQFFLEDLMPVYKKVTENISTSPPERVALDERFITLFLPEDAQERLEAQELRQIVHHAMNNLSEEEFRVIESRYQHKKSPGQAASRMGITRDALVKLEQSALKKLRTTLVSWQKGL